MKNNLATCASLPNFPRIFILNANYTRVGLLNDGVEEEKTVNYCKNIGDYYRDGIVVCSFHIL